MEISGRQEKLETESDVEIEMTLLAIASILAVSSSDCKISKASNNRQVQVAEASRKVGTP